MDRENGRVYSPQHSHREGMYQARVEFDAPTDSQRIEDEVNIFFQRASSRDGPYSDHNDDIRYAEEAKMIEFDDPYARIARSRGKIPSAYDRNLQKLIHSGKAQDSKNRLREFNNARMRGSTSRSRSPHQGWGSGSGNRVEFIDLKGSQLPGKISITLEKLASNVIGGSRQNSREMKRNLVEPTTNSTFQNSRQGRNTMNPSIRGWTAESPSLEYSQESPSRWRGHDSGSPGYDPQRDRKDTKYFAPTGGLPYQPSGRRQHVEEDPDPEDDDDPEFGPSLKSNQVIETTRHRFRDKTNHQDSDSDEEKRAMYERLEKECKLEFQKSTRAKKHANPGQSKLTRKAPDSRSQLPNQIHPAKDSLISSQLSQPAFSRLKPSSGPAQPQEYQQGPHRPKQASDPRDPKDFADSLAQTASFVQGRPQQAGPAFRPAASNGELSRGEPDLPPPRLAESATDHSQRMSACRGSLEGPHATNMHLSLRNLQKEVNLKNEEIRALRNELQKLSEETTTLSGPRRHQEASLVQEDPRLAHVLKTLKVNEEILVFTKQSLQQKTKWIGRLQSVLTSPDGRSSHLGQDLTPPNDSAVVRELEEAILQTKHAWEDLEASIRGPTSMLAPGLMSQDRAGSVGNRSSSWFEHQTQTHLDSGDKGTIKCAGELKHLLDEVVGRQSMLPTDDEPVVWEGLLERVRGVAKELFALKLVDHTVREKVVSLEKNNTVLENLLLSKSDELRQKELGWAAERAKWEKQLESLTEECKKAERLASSAFRPKIEALEAEIVTLKAKLSTQTAELAKQTKKTDDIQSQRLQERSKSELLEGVSQTEDSLWKQVHLTLEYASSKIVGPSFTPTQELLEFEEKLRSSPCSAVAHNFERFLEVERNHQQQLSHTFKEKFLNQNNFLQEMRLQLEVLSDILSVIERYNKSSMKKSPDSRGKEAEKVVHDVSILLERMQIDKHKLRQQIDYTNKTRSENNALLQEHGEDILEEYENSLKGMEFPEYRPSEGRQIDEVEDHPGAFTQKGPARELSEGLSRQSLRGSMFAKQGGNPSHVMDTPGQKPKPGVYERKRSGVSGLKEVASDSEPWERRRPPPRPQMPHSYGVLGAKESDTSLQQDALERHSMRTEPLAEYDPDLLQIMLAQARVIQERSSPSQSPWGRAASSADDEYL